MIYLLQLAPHPTDTTRRAFKIVVEEGDEATAHGDVYGMYNSLEELMMSLEALLRMEASR